MRRPTTILWTILLLSWTAAARADIGDNDVGMNTHVPQNDVVDACVDLGVGWIRVDNNWLEHQPTSAAPAYTAALDGAVTYAVSSGLSVFMTIAYTPAWASSGDTDGVSRNDVPAAGTYEAYVRDTVAHYRTMGVTHFGLWNETNLDGFWEGTLDQYVDVIVVPGLTAIDQGCADAGYSDCVALGPELASLSEWDDDLEAILTRMDTHSVTFDVYVHHIYHGFAETGVEVWDNDRFFNTLDQQRFWFTRRSFLQVLGETGHTVLGLPDREVWITETGYHNEPAMDASEQAIQETYYMRVIDEQLARQWYTNTFFYEIQDSFDELDGFGIIRRTSGPDSTFSDNFDFKDAYWALRSRIASEPAFQPEPCTRQCCDGLDNDDDGLADMADPGCTDEDDDDESDDPVVEEPTVQAVPAPAVTLDGYLDEWSGASFVTITSPDDFVSADHAPGDASDLSASFALMWDAANLYLALEVTDDVHTNTHASPDIWMSDSVQAALDTARDGGHAYDGANDFELGWASTDSGDVAQCWEAPASAPASTSQVVTTTSGTTLTYEIRILAVDLQIPTLADSMQMGFTLLVNDDDGDGREGWIEWTPGIGSFKDPDSFGTLELVSTLPPADDPVADIPAEDVSDAPPDASVDVVEDLAADATADLPADAPATDVTTSGSSGGCACSPQ